MLDTLMKAEELVAIGEKPPIELSIFVFINKYIDDIGDLEELYHLVANEICKTGKSFEFIFVDDGNKGNTFEILKKIRRENPGVKIIRFSKPFGEATALLASLERASGKTIITMSSYLQIEPSEVHKMLGRLETGYDVAIGWRYPRVDSLLSRFHSVCFNWIIRKMTGVYLHDISCSLKAFKRSVLEEISVCGDLFSFIPVLAYRQGFRVSEVKVKHREQRSKKRIYSLGTYIRRLLDILTMFFLVKFTKKPLRFFGLVGSSMLGIGFLVNIYLAIERVIHHVGIANRPLLLLGVLLVVLGLQIISIGLIGEIIIFTHSQEVKEYHIEEILG